MYNMFEAILYINLEYRKDRKKSILNEIKKIKNFDERQVYRIDAVLEPLCGHLGCGKSHVKALELAIKNNWSSILMLEDDFVFTKDYKGEENFHTIQNIEWDVMLLAKGHQCNQYSDYEYLKKAYRATTTSGYIVRQHYYPILLENFKNSVATMEQEFQIHSETFRSQNMPISKMNYCSAIDQYWFSLQEKDTFYMFEPPIGTQGNLWSDNNCSYEHQVHHIKYSTMVLDIIPHIIMYGPWIAQENNVNSIQYLIGGEKVYLMVDGIHTKMVSEAGVAKYYTGTIDEFKPESWDEYTYVGDNYRIKFIE